jgi:hypothetical protein
MLRRFASRAGGRAKSLVAAGQRMPLVQREERVRQGLAYVVVARDQPGGAAVGAGDAVHGGGVAQPVVDGVRVGEEVVGEEVLVSGHELTLSAP